MAAPRATHLLALRTLSLNSCQLRNLFRTSPALDPRNPPALPPTPCASNPPPNPVRQQFHTSSPYFTANDNSTIDFAYLPHPDPLASDLINETLLIPILPHSADSAGAPLRPHLSSSAPSPPPAEAEVMKPEISSMSADAVYLPMSELSDHHAENVDFHAMAERVAEGVRRLEGRDTGGTREERASVMKEIWNSLVDDMFGMRVGASAAEGTKKGGS